jgi:hypothetical protein
MQNIYIKEVQRHSKIKTAHTIQIMTSMVSDMQIFSHRYIYI